MQAECQDWAYGIPNYNAKHIIVYNSNYHSYKEETTKTAFTEHGEDERVCKMSVE